MSGEHRAKVASFQATLDAAVPDLRPMVMLSVSSADWSTPEGYSALVRAPGRVAVHARWVLDGQPDPAAIRRAAASAQTEAEYQAAWRDGLAGRLTGRGDRVAVPISKLTPAVVDTFCAEVERGQAVPFAAALCDITGRSAFAWLAQGRADEAAGLEPGWGPGQSPHLLFLHRYMRARARLAGEIGEAIRQNRTGPGERNHSALAYFERTRFPDVYSDKALEASLVALGDAPEKAEGSPGQADAAVRVELVRCGACGEDQLPGKRLCGDCGAALPAKEAT